MTEIEREAETLPKELQNRDKIAKAMKEAFEQFSAAIDKIEARIKERKTYGSL